MTTLLVIILVLAVLHLVYEAIIAPTLRLRMKYRFFELRDRAVRLRLEQPEALPDLMNVQLLDVINDSMRYISDLSITLILRLTSKVTPEIRHEAARRARMFDNAENEEVRQIAVDLRDYMLFVLLINSLGGIVMILPLIVMVFRHRTPSEQTSRSTGSTQRSIRDAATCTRKEDDMPTTLMLLLFAGLAAFMRSAYRRAREIDDYYTPYQLPKNYRGHTPEFQNFRQAFDIARRSKQGEIVPDDEYEAL